MNYPARLTRLQAALPLSKLDTLLVTHLPNIRYLCGFTGSSGALVVNDRGAVFFTDGRYTAQARSEVRGARIIVARKPPLFAAAEWLSKRKKTGRTKHTLGIEAEHLSVALRDRLVASIPKELRLRTAPPLIEATRMVKDADEVELIRRAVNLGASLFDTVLKTARPGVKEMDVAAEMEYTAARLGTEGMSFETIIASGSRSALPHGRASQALIPAQGFVVCDFGVILDGYCSDMTRSLYVGSASREAREFYQAVREAQLAGIDSVRPGVAVGEVDRAARRVLKKARLGKFFSHSTGHGVGLEIHELPRVASGQSEILQPGMIITIEPGAYIPGKWGVRIEDMVVVTRQGCEVLTPTSKELQTL
jgi:Xaa-Pro aminopeptidase